MHDFAPEDTAPLRVLESRLIGVLRQYAYQEVRTPIVEKLELFKRSIGEVTDIVEKEMYAFEDRGGDWLALRPEGTASTLRAGVQHGWLHNQQQRFWYLGPFFRRERPQKGRYRQFHQLGVETFGMAGPDIDIELILLTQSMWKAVGLDSANLELQINTLGDSKARARHRADLIAYLSGHSESLDEDAERRLHTNPLRILDSKNPQVQALVKDAPLLFDYLDTEAKEHFEKLCLMLEQCGVDAKINPTLVRGLDYYNRTVFEWVTHQLGAQGTICAGGRYDSLVGQMGGRDTPAAGFAIGIERLYSLVEDNLNTQTPVLDAYVIALGDQVTRYAFHVCEQIRQEFPDFAIQMNCGGGSIKSQMKRADRANARLAIIIGDDELKNENITVKNLQQDVPQITCGLDQLSTLLKV
jgi:histidyl-tRNA synthetase